jgi:hypothetical protein
MNNREEKYLSYMLRLWQAVSEAGGSWRASLEDPRTGQRTGFAELEDLFGYLAKRTRGEQDDDAGRRTEGANPETGEGS